MVKDGGQDGKNRVKTGYNFPTSFGQTIHSIQYIHTPQYLDHPIRWEANDLGPGGVTESCCVTWVDKGGNGTVLSPLLASVVGV